MFAVNDFVLRYEKYSDDVLAQMHASIGDYGDEAKEALEIVIEKRGGLEAILTRLAKEKAERDEVNRIVKETLAF